MDRWLSDAEDNRCCFCKCVPESISHLYFRCTFVKSIWNRVRNWLNIHRSMTTLQSTVKWIKKDFGGALVHRKSSGFSVCSHSLHHMGL